MREIKFRGISIDTGVWEYGYLVANPSFDRVNICNKKGINEMQMNAVIPESVSQFIGLKDKNGVEIYEGGVVEGRYMVQRSLDPNEEPEIIHFKGVIEYAEGCFYVKSNNGQCVFSFTYTDYELEVIGNLYANPSFTDKK